MTVQVTDAIQTLRDTWRTEWGYTPRQINEGECMEFINDLFLEFELDEAVQRMDTNDLPSSVVDHEDGVDTEPYHMWITDGELHYDVEVPNGVASWKQLPFFERTLGL